jgi:ribose transport system ATP-binding protein
MGVLWAEHVTKIYPGTVALDDVSVEFPSGKIHAFVGKNGSGKSTLLKIFAGAVIKDEGQIFLDEQPLESRSPLDAVKHGIATVYQELSVIPGVSVAENIFMGRLPQKKNGLIDWPKTYHTAKECLYELGIEINPYDMLENLSISQMQMVEIAKAMSQKPKVLQLDEPTSALSQSEVKTLFSLLKKLREQDVIIIYISHRLQELWEVADTCTVLRDGRYIGTRDLSVTDRKQILEMMFGDVQVHMRPEDLVPNHKTVLEVKGLARYGKFEDVSFTLKRGEVLGIAGMLGSGRTELLRAIFGADGFDAGEVRCFGKKLNKLTPEKMKNMGVGMVQEDRQRSGIIAEDSISLNMILASIADMGKGILYDKNMEDGMVRRQIENLDIKLASSKAHMNSLSGGNQQKVIVGRWLNIKPQIILFDEPSRGIDVSAKQQIFRIIWQLSREGISSIMVSSELEELLEVCTRILIMREGRMYGEADLNGLTIDKLYLTCMGED